MRQFSSGTLVSWITFVNGVFFETISTLMVFNLYPLGLKKENDPLLLADTTHPKHPVLLIHGIFHNSSAFLKIKQRLKAFGWRQIYSLNLSTYSKGIPDLAQEISQKIDSILKDSDFKKVDIVAHSLGGMIARYYIQCLEGHPKIRHCITLGTPHQGTLLAKIGLGKSIRDLKKTSLVMKKLNSTPLPKSVKFTSLWSPFDTLVLPPKNSQFKNAKSFDHVKNIKVEDAGHAGLLFSKRVFYHIANILDSSRRYPPILKTKLSLLERLPLAHFIST